MGIKLKEVQKLKRPLMIDYLECGDIFIYNNCLFIFVNDTFDDDCVSEGDYYGINLSEGNVATFDSGTIIKRIKSSLEIEIDKDEIEEWV